MLSLLFFYLSSILVSGVTRFGHETSISNQMSSYLNISYDKTEGLTITPTSFQSFDYMLVDFDSIVRYLDAGMYSFNMFVLKVLTVVS